MPINKPHKAKKDEDEEEDDEEEKEDEEEEEDEDEEDEEEEDEDKKKDKDEDEDEEEEEEEEDEEDEDEDDADEEEKAEEDDDDSSDKASWKVVGQKAQKKLVAKTQQLRASTMRREVWLQDGDKKKFRFMSRDPLAMIVQHSIPRKRKGKMIFPKYTCSQDQDCEFCAKGVNASISAVYEVHNFEKFTKKDGTEINVDARFYVVPESRHQLIQKVLAHCKPAAKDWLVEVERVGGGRTTAYSFVPLKKKPLTDEEKKLKPLSEIFDDAFKPLPSKEQKLAISSGTFEDESDD